METDNRDGMWSYGMHATQISPPVPPMPPVGTYPGMHAGFPGAGTQTGTTPNISQIEHRINVLERQIKRLDARISRIETPYPGSPTTATTGPGYKTPQLAEDAYSYPYHTSMQMI